MGEGATVLLLLRFVSAPSQLELKVVGRAESGTVGAALAL